MAAIELCKQKARVLIIGAGTAGIAATNCLIENGITDITVLEASNRIGGRVLTSKIGAHEVIELGAHWIHGVLGNPVYEVASKNRLIDFNATRPLRDTLAVTSDGQKVSIKKVQEVREAYSKYIHECCQYFECGRDPPSHIKSVGDFMDKCFHINFYKFLEEEEELCERRMILDNFLKREVCTSGCHSVHDLDAGQFGSYTELPGGNHQIPKGFQSLLDIMLSNIPQDSLLINHEVSSIHWNKDSPMVTVECTNNKSFACDHVICTVSLGCLQKLVHEKAFKPPLPDAKLQSMGRLKLGVVNKIYLLFDTPLQPLHVSDNITVILLFWRPERTEGGTNTKSSSDMKDSWFQKLFAFTFINRNILMTWLAGDEASYMETLSDEEVIDTCWMVLKNCLDNQHLPKPSQVIRSAWGSNPFTRGSYSFLPVGSKQVDIRVLAEPVLHATTSQPVILFAGEATHPTYYSTVHGAYESGLVAAKTLVDIYSGT